MTEVNSTWTNLLVSVVNLHLLPFAVSVAYGDDVLVDSGVSFLVIV